MGNSKYSLANFLYSDNAAKNFKFIVNESDDGKVIRHVIPIHSFILKKISPVFKAMLSRDLKESEENSMEIKDFDSKCIKIAVNMMYEQKCDELNCETAIELYKFFDKIDIQSLKKHMMDYLKENVTAIDGKTVLKFALEYDLDDLLDATCVKMAEKSKQQTERDAMAMHNRITFGGTPLPDPFRSITSKNSTLFGHPQ